MSRARRPEPKSSTYITPAGAKRYRDELAALWDVERPKLAQAVADAAAEGDRSENAEYIYGKKKLREMDRRIRFLIKRLDVIQVVQPEGTRDETRVFFGAWVEIEDADGSERKLRIVGPDETDMHPDYISMDSPMGRALLRRRLDDEVTVKRPKGDAIFTIMDIVYGASS